MARGLGRGLGEQPPPTASFPAVVVTMAAHNFAVFYEALEAAQHYALAETLKSGRPG